MIGWSLPAGNMNTPSQISRTFAGSSNFGFVNPAAGHGKPRSGGGGGGGAAPSSQLPAVLPDQVPGKPPEQNVPGSRNGAFSQGAGEGKGPGGGGGGPGGGGGEGPPPIEGPVIGEEGAGLLARAVPAILAL